MAKAKFASVFLSHSSKDKKFVEAVAECLERRGITAWLDKNELAAGMDLGKSLSVAISNQVAVVAFLSKDSVKSVWVNKELADALENEKANGGWLIPVYLGKRLALVKKSAVLGRWMDSSGSSVNRLGVDFASYVVDQWKLEDCERVAGEICESVSKLLAQSPRAGAHIVVLDQRGDGQRRGRYVLSDQLAEVDGRVLVFRPDNRERSHDEILVGEKWNEFVQGARTTLNALEIARNPGRVLLAGDSQLGLAYAMGKCFNRTTAVELECYNTRRGSVFSNLGQVRHEPLPGGDEYCETTRSNTFPLAPEPLPARRQYARIALLVGTYKYVPFVVKHLEVASPEVPLVWVKSGEFTNSEQVMKYVANVVAIVGRLNREYGTSVLSLYCTLPVNVVPLLAANLTWHVIPSIEFMESSPNAADEKEKYVALPMNWK